MREVGLQARAMTGPTRSALSAVLMLLFLPVVFVVWLEV